MKRCRRLQWSPFRWITVIATAVVLALTGVSVAAAQTGASPAHQTLTASVAPTSASSTQRKQGGQAGTNDTPSVIERTTTLPATMGSDGVKTMTVRVDATTVSPSSPSQAESTTGVQSSPPANARSNTAGLTAAQRLFGKDFKSKSGKPYLSGGTTPGSHETLGSGANYFGEQRGRPLDAMTHYFSNDSWDSMATSCETWLCKYTTEFPGRLVVGVSLTLGANVGGNPAQMQEIADGKHDDVFKKLAADMKRYGRDDSILRIGLEANAEAKDGGWFPWGVNTAGASNELFKNAFNRVAALFKQESDKFVISFDISLGKAIPGSSDPYKMFERLYPGDKYVQIVGIDIYDAYDYKASTEEEFNKNIMWPTRYTGFGHILKFAEEHNLGVGVYEWNVVSVANSGGGDNPAFIELMAKTFEKYQHLMVAEMIFLDKEPGNVDNDFLSGAMPRAYEAYKKYVKTDFALAS